MITSTIYKEYSDEINASLLRNDGVIDAMDSTKSTYEDTFDATSSENNFIQSANTIISFSNDIQGGIYDRMAILQKQVEKDNGMLIDAWLTQEGIKVEPRFAEASDDIGYPISDENIIVTMYLPDGGTDDDIRAALEAGADRLVLGGTFIIDNNIDIKEEYGAVVIEGQPRATLISTPIYRGRDRLMFYFIDEIAEATFRRLDFDGNNHSNSQAIYAYTVPGGNRVVRVEDCTATRCGKNCFYLANTAYAENCTASDSGMHGFVLRDGVGTLVNCTASNCLGQGLDTSGPTTVVNVTDCTFDNNGYGSKFAFIDGYNITGTFTNCIFSNNTNQGFWNSDGGGTWQSGGAFYNCQFLNNGHTGCQLPTGPFTITDCVFNGNAGYGLVGGIITGSNITCDRNGLVGWYPNAAGTHNVTNLYARDNGDPAGDGGIYSHYVFGSIVVNIDGGELTGNMSYGVEIYYAPVTCTGMVFNLTNMDLTIAGNQTKCGKAQVTGAILNLINCTQSGIPVILANFQEVLGGVVNIT